MADKRKPEQPYSYQTNRFKVKKDNKYGHYIMVKGIIHQEDMILINKYVPNMGVPEVHKTITNRYMGRN